MSIFFTLLGLIPGLTEKFFNWQIQKSNVELEGFKTAAGFDNEAFKAWLSATVEINNQKIAANAWWGAKLIILTAGWPAAIHMAAIFLDSLPFDLLLYAHEVGAWGIPKPPPPYDGYEWSIVQSFFIVTPLMPIASAATQWLSRKR